MEWQVIKMGSIMFDTLHAYGFGLLLAYAYEQPILLEEQGCQYRFSHDGSCLIHTSYHLLDEIIQVPADPALLLEDCGSLFREQVLLLANLDGLLAALLTYPAGIRAFSLDDVRQKHRLDVSAPARSLAKVCNRAMRWTSLLKNALRDPSHWLEDLLSDYHPLHAQHPIPMPKQSTDLTVPMTLDPAFSYDTRRQRSDGTAPSKVNMTVRGTRFAVFLAYIGAMRFLRAQRVHGDLINYTLPVATRLLFSPHLTLPLLTQASHVTPGSAVLAQSLQYVLASPISEATWHTLAFQTLQLQGTHQSISVHRGCIDMTWLEQLKMQMGTRSLFFWRRLLCTPQKALAYEREYLEDALLSRQASSYLTHLKDVAHCAAYRTSDDEAYVYSLKEVRIMMDTMEDSGQIPLGPILERKVGTLRFGQALRQLKSSGRSAAARDVLDALGEVQTCDQLVRVLYHLAEECALLAAKMDYVIFPSEEDFLFLSEDVARYGAYTIAGMVMLLSSLRPPRSKESPQRDALTLWRLLRAVLRAVALEAEATEDSRLPSPMTVVTSPERGLVEGETPDDSITDHHL